MSASTKTAIQTAAAGAVLGALAGWDLDLMGATSSPAGVASGAVAGLVLGGLFGFWQARSDAGSGKPAPRSAWLMLLGFGLLALSIFSFITTQRIPGVRPLVVASAPIDVTKPGSASVSFTPDITGTYAVFLTTGEDPAAKMARDLGLKKETKPAELPPRETVTWSSDLPGSERPDEKVEAFDATPSRIGLGGLTAEAGKKYTLTATVVKPFAGSLKTQFEVHRSTRDWGRAFPRVLAAGALGLFSGIAGIMLMAYGGIQRYNARLVKRET